MSDPKKEITCVRTDNFEALIAECDEWKAKYYEVRRVADEQRASLEDQLAWSLKNEAQYKGEYAKACEERNRYKAALLGKKRCECK